MTTEISQSKADQLRAMLKKNPNLTAKEASKKLHVTSGYFSTVKVKFIKKEKNNPPEHKYMKIFNALPAKFKFSEARSVAKDFGIHECNASTIIMSGKLVKRVGPGEYEKLFKETSAQSAVDQKVQTKESQPVKRLSEKEIDATVRQRHAIILGVIPITDLSDVATPDGATTVCKATIQKVFDMILDAKGIKFEIVELNNPKAFEIRERGV